eukprot:TRINITY_DN4933_c0_g1_i1.p1 TRINITY_DN4933_c0_g1~~TRINITY_DN4933_c0_g1_i1.p1  ORF type:complete len:324 (+),score=77.15 TRINITY_DN4933_c0_g1_i1:42-1013(+)
MGSRLDLDRALLDAHNQNNLLRLEYSRLSRQRSLLFQARDSLRRSDLYLKYSALQTYMKTCKRKRKRVLERPKMRRLPNNNINNQKTTPIKTSSASIPNSPILMPTLATTTTSSSQNSLDSTSSPSINNNNIINEALGEVPLSGGDEYSPGNVVLVKLPGYPSWPALITPESQVSQSVLDAKIQAGILVFLYGTHEYAWMTQDSISPFDQEGVSKLLVSTPTDDHHKSWRSAFDETSRNMLYEKLKKMPPPVSSSEDLSTTLTTTPELTPMITTDEAKDVSAGEDSRKDPDPEIFRSSSLHPIDEDDEEVLLLDEEDFVGNTP